MTTKLRSREASALIELRRERRPTAPLVLTAQGAIEPIVARVRENLRRHRSGLPRATDANPVVIFPGGAQRCVIAAGMFRGIGEYLLGFNTCIGISAGAAPFLHHDETGERGMDIFWNENVRRRIFDLRRPWNFLDLRGLERALRHEKPPNSLDGLRVHPTRFLVGVYDRRLQRQLFLDLREQADPIGVTLRSMAMPLFHPWSRFVDGDVGEPLPISYAINELGATVVLVVMSASPMLWLKHLAAAGSTLEAVLDRLGRGRYARAFARYPRRYLEELSLVANPPPGVNIAAVYPTRSPISLMCQDAVLLERAARQATDFSRDLFNKLEVTWEA